jgi:hypothetical protein
LLYVRLLSKTPRDSALLDDVTRAEQSSQGACPLTGAFLVDASVSPHQAQASVVEERDRATD